jgi:hypothetical protein
MPVQKGLTLVGLLSISFVVSILYLFRGSHTGFGLENDDTNTNWPVKEPGHEWTKHVVVAKMSYEDRFSSWLETGDLHGAIPKVYIADDPSAPLSVPANKGHEAMVYLTYLIDHYDALPDVAVFMHAHQNSWHQDGLLEYDALEMLKRLSPEAVTREGYRNLRCEWNPGCPAWIHPKAFQYADSPRPEEPGVADAWAQLFPSTPVPDIIAQPCCGQFALSKQRMLSIPKARYQVFRDWLLKTDLGDDISGRVFEYLWAYIFTAKPVFCPDMRTCYCDGYGVCFLDDKSFDLWFKLRWEWQQLEKQLRDWKIVAAGKVSSDRAGTLPAAEIKELEKTVPLTGLGQELADEMNELQRQMDEKRLAAIAAGDDPAVRAKVAGRKWKEGDGF